jgi:hypothetical protein
MRRRFGDDLDLGFIAYGLVALVIAVWFAPHGPLAWSWLP